MAEQNYSIDTDLKELKTMVEALVPYIYQDDLYADVGLPIRLTPGAVLLRLERLRGLRNQMSAEQGVEFDHIDAQHRAVRKEWSVAYTKKLLQEANSRLRDLQTYINECREDPRSCAGAYMPEALRRTMIQGILNSLPASDRQSADVDSRLKFTDDGLRRFVKESGFIWSEILRPVYAPSIYWWLYGRPPQSS
jgi:hypothetical protein